MPARKHAVWLPELSQGLLVMAAALLYDDLFLYQMPHEVETLDERFYRKPRAEGLMDSFGLSHVGAQFSLLALGLLVACSTFLYEYYGIRNGRKQKETM